MEQYANTISCKKGAAKMIAHRGVSGLETENTCAAFVAAGNRSYFGIETDVHVTADGRFVVVHDSDLFRVSGEHLVVEDCTYDLISQVVLYDMEGGKSRRDLRVPTFEEYLSICKKYGKHAVVEIKDREKGATWSEENLNRLADVIEQMDYIDHTTFIAFNIENLAILRRRSEAYDMQFLCCNELDDHFERMVALRIGADMGDWWRFNHSDEATRMLHEKGLPINCWTINDPDRAEKYAAWGVDYITTNILE